jgi:hypothetical protein
VIVENPYGAQGPWSLITLNIRGGTTWGMDYWLRVRSGRLTLDSEIIVLKAAASGILN